MVQVLEDNLEVSYKDLAHLVSQVMKISRSKASQVVRTMRHKENNTFMKKYAK